MVLFLCEKITQSHWTQWASAGIRGEGRLDRNQAGWGGSIFNT